MYPVPSLPSRGNRAWVSEGGVLWISKGSHSHRTGYRPSVDGERPISAATSDSLRSSSVRAIALRLGNSLPYTETSRLVPRPFFTLDPYDSSEYLSHRR